MTAPARLTGLRLLGFKSFAERTAVEFGPGISAIVGPNGSGKSNLADALRWTLGEAGRQLRTRRAEDVIFAGSSARRATSMADVTLLLDNVDRLLPVDFGQVELGRRLYRSGENEYLLNRQRVRLRDLIELLDAGNLADNAFLFIGQGMVDQALALRPEERRPLFEEAAGVRRHERRRRQSEAELAEAEMNLERLRDVLAELRPQARRLAAQAEQLLARRSAGHDLAEALVAAARARWHDLASAAEREQANLQRAHAEADGALAELRAAEEDSQRISRALAERAQRESAQRARLDEQRARTVELRVASARVRSELDAAARDRQRIANERQAIADRLAEARRTLARPLPSLDPALESDAERVRAELERLVGAAHGAQPQSGGGDVPADERAAGERRRAVLAAQVADAEARLRTADTEAADAIVARDRATTSAAAAGQAVALAEAELRRVRANVESAQAAEARARREHAAAEATRASVQASLDAAERAIDRLVNDALGRAARARGGMLLAEGVEIDPPFRAAVGAALGSAAQGWLVDGDATVAALPRQGGVLVVRRPASAAERPERLVGLAHAAGGGHLGDAVRRDPQGELTRLLGRTLWVETLEGALGIYSQLPPGWQIVTLGGQVVGEPGVVRLAGANEFLGLREERERLAGETVAAAAAVSSSDAGVDRARAAREAAESELQERRAALDAARREQSVAAELDSTSQRPAEHGLREQAWQSARLAGLRADLADVEAAVGSLPAIDGDADRLQSPMTDVGPRIAELRARQAALASNLARQRAAEKVALDTHRRAEVAIMLDEARSGQLDAELEALAGRDAELLAEDERLAAELATAAASEHELARAVEQIVGAAGHDRTLLLAAESAAAAARERLRLAETRSRAAEAAAMEAVLQLDAQREQLLVELAGIGSDAQAVLAGRAVDALAAEAGEPRGEELAAALDAAAARWRSEPVPAAELPTPGRLAALRRRFHELGAGNPFAAAEYAEARSRLATLDAQAADLEAAIAATRRLIGDLNELIAKQFRSTFAALEGAFARRFEQLFDGGEAQLSLTAPDDLSATGVEITARPPGKKRQPLQMLSGGERALTAVALLLAMLEVRPVPFCVLDEVDAALDEANIARFAQALRGLADRTQFIVITHNRGTIEAADALYGVTIGSDAVSRVVSLRLPPASGNGAASREAAAEVLA